VYRQEDNVTLEEIRGQATEELTKLANDSREKLFKLHYAQISESVESTKNVRGLRKQIARIKTVLRQRELVAVAEAQGK
jgi:large subunit ribosomal protein L29